jgi:hypothetical protein
MPRLSIEEWKEIQHLRRAISDNPFAVTPERQERFSELFSKSIMGKGDLPLK